MAVVVEILVIARLLTTEDLGWVLPLVGCVALAAVTATRWPFGALFVMIAATAMPRYYMEIYGWRARPEHIVGAFVLLAWLYHAVVRKTMVKLDGLDKLVILYVLANYLSSALTSPDRSATLRWALLNNLGTLPYFYIRFFGSGRRYINRAFSILLTVGTVEAAYGVICFLANGLFGMRFGVNRGYYFYGRISAAYGSQYEPNLFGMYAGCFAMMFLALYIFDRSRRRSRYGGAFLIATAGVAVSLARQAVVVCAVGIIFLFYWGTKRGRKLRRLFPASIAAGFLVALLVGGMLAARFRPLLANPTADPTTFSRLFQDMAALQDVKVHPLLGNGTDSFQLLFSWNEYLPGWSTVKGYIGNTPIMILHDTGIVGLGLFVAFALWLARRALRLLATANEEELPVVAALTAGALVYAGTALAADVTMLGFLWVHLGLLTSVVCSLEAGRKRVAQAAPLKKTGESAGAGRVGNRDTATATASEIRSSLQAGSQPSPNWRTVSHVAKGRPELMS